MINGCRWWWSWLIKIAWWHIILGLNIINCIKSKIPHAPPDNPKILLQISRRKTLNHFDLLLNSRLTKFSSSTCCSGATAAG
jgi:hypothetical protein